MIRDFLIFRHISKNVSLGLSDSKSCNSKIPRIKGFLTETPALFAVLGGAKWTFALELLELGGPRPRGENLSGPKTGG